MHPEVQVAPSARPGAAVHGAAVLDLDVVRRAEVRSAPFTHLYGTGLLRPEAIAAVQAGFPSIHTAGLHPIDQTRPEGAFVDLIDDLCGDALSRVLGEKFGQDFTAATQEVGVGKLSAAHEGRIHRGSGRKAMCLLVYLNDVWRSPAGRFRILRGRDSFDDYAAEIVPVTGAFVAFLGADDSWHGHTPFVGERRLVQAAWLRDEGGGAAEQTVPGKRRPLLNALRGLLERCA